jgi:hypothetical protein
MSRRRGFLVVAVWAFVIALFIFASWLAGQQRQRGTGYTTSHASWEQQNGRRLATFPIDHGARPWGDDGGPPADDAIFDAPDFALYLRRYAGGSSTIPKDEQGVGGRGIGAWGEAMGQNVEGLKRWYVQQSPQHQAQWDGVPTVEEAFDAAFSQPRNGAFYRAPVVDPTPTPRPTPAATPPPPVVTPTPSPTPEPTATPANCTPIEPETCPCRESASGRWLAQQIAAWPRNEDGSLQPGKRPAVAVWRLVLAAGEYLADSGETCPCFGTTGNLSYCVESAP